MSMRPWASALKKGPQTQQLASFVEVARAFFELVCAEIELDPAKKSQNRHQKARPRRLRAQLHVKLLPLLQRQPFDSPTLAHWSHRHLQLLTATGHGAAVAKVIQDSPDSPVG